MVAVLLTLLVLLQFPADFGSVAHAAQKNEIRGTISVASNISQQDDTEGSAERYTKTDGA